MSLTPEDIRAIVTAFEASDWSELSLQHGETQLQMSRTGAPPVTVEPISSPAVIAPPAATLPAASAPSASSAPAAAPAVASPTAADSSPTAPAAEGVAVLAPTLGLFWCSPQPGAPPFVEVGQHVGPDDTVCIVEVMKLMSHVKAGVAGVVAAIPVENGAMVEHGDTLVVISLES